MSKKYFTKQERSIIQIRSNYRCEYCQMLEDYIRCVNEHIIATSNGGSDDLENIANACGGCNSHKYNKVEGFDKVSQQTVPLFHPRKDEWKSHFMWNEDFSLIIGITPIGRVTVEILKMNRQILLNLRTILKLSGEHPPNEFKSK